MNGDLRIYPKSSYAVTVLANMNPPAAQRISEYLDPRLPTAPKRSRGDARLLGQGATPSGWIQTAAASRSSRYVVRRPLDAVVSNRVSTGPKRRAPKPMRGGI
jgi:hypothetical protein